MQSDATRDTRLNITGTLACKYNDWAQKGPGDAQRRTERRANDGGRVVSEGRVITVITACKIVPVFLRAIDTVQAVPSGSPLAPCICMSPRISFAVARPFVKRIADYAYNFMRVFRRLDLESLNGKRAARENMQMFDQSLRME